MNDFKKLLDVNHAPAIPAPKHGQSVRKAEFTKTSGSIEVPENAAEGDAEKFLLASGQNPADWEVTGFRRSEWGDPENPFVSTRFTFSRRKRGLLTIPDEQVEQARERLQSFVPPVRFEDGDGPEVGAILNLADLQGGKSEGGGVDGLTQRLTDGLENAVAWLDRCRKTYSVRELVLVNNGDIIEGCDGNYASQLFTVELNHRQQMNLALDIWDMYARTLFPYFEKKQFVTVLSNHGELGRFGSNKNRTSDSDSADALLAESLQRIYAGVPGLDDIKWTIPHDEMNVYTEAAGVRLGFNHGHKIKGSDAKGFESWLNGQVRGDADAWAVDVWVTAHRHNFQAWDLGSCSAFQCPSMDGGSKWLRDSTGKYSNSGMIGFLVGDHSKVKWSDLAFL